MRKEQWHKEYKYETASLSYFKCKKCSSHTYIDRGCVHHTTYIHKGGIYNDSAYNLLKLGKIIWVCNYCHLDIHRSESIDGVTKIVASYVTVCNECGKDIFNASANSSTYCYNCYKDEEHIDEDQDLAWNNFLPDPNR